MRLVILIAVFVLLGPLAARADDPKEQARRDVTAGLAAQSAGRYDEAIALYKKAYAAIPHPELLFDLGQAYRLKGDLETAIDYYRRYLEAEPNGRVAGDAVRWRSDLTARLADRRKADDTGKAGAANKPDPARKPDAGKIDARKTDEARRAENARKAEDARKAQEAQALEDARRAQEAQALEDARRAEDARKAEEVRKAEEARNVAEARKAEDARAAASESSQHSTAALVAALGGGSALIGGLVFGVLANNKLDEATRICPGRHCASDTDSQRASQLLSQSRTRGTISTLLVVGGAGGLVLSGVMWWTGRKADSRGVAVAPLVGGGTLGVAIGGAL